MYFFQIACIWTFSKTRLRVNATKVALSFSELRACAGTSTNDLGQVCLQMDVPTYENVVFSLKTPPKCLAINDEALFT